MPDLKLGTFSDGVNNVSSEHSLSETTARVLRNVDVLADGKVKRRRGYQRVTSTTGAHSGFSHNGYVYYADGPSLFAWTPEFGAEAIADVTPDAPVVYEDINGFLYVTDGRHRYIIDGVNAVKNWAVEAPSGMPNLTTNTFGTLPVGLYQVTMTFMRGQEESGAGMAQSIALNQQGSIEISNIPQPFDPDVTRIRIYVSNPSGETMYASATLPVGTMGVHIMALPSGKKLETQFYEPLPAGQELCLYKGFMMSARDNVLYFSKPLQYGVYNPTEDYLQIAGRIDLLKAVQNGVYIAAGQRTYFLSGNSPEEFQLRIVHTRGAVPGTGLVIPASTFDFEGLKTGDVVVWWATNGTMVVGFPDGQISILREAELALPEYSRGAILARRQDGAKQLVSVLSEPKRDNALAVADTVSATVYRNGIEL